MIPGWFGSQPSCTDRILATRMGAYAASHLIEGCTGYMVGLQGGNLVLGPLENCVCALRPLDLKLLELSVVME